LIGVLLQNNNNNTIVEEFFQLFKTPWIFYQPKRKLDVIITDRDDISGLDAPLIIIFQKESAGSFPSIGTEDCPDHAPAVLKQADGPDFPIYSGTVELPTGKSCLTVKASGQCVGSLVAQEQRFILQLGFNLFDEVQFILEHGQPLVFAHVPTLDIHIANLRKWILNAGLQLIEIPPHPQGSPFFACLTHDVDFAGIRQHRFDRTMGGFLYRALFTSTIGFFKGRYSFSHLRRNWKAVAELPLIYAGLKRDFWFQFRKYVEIEKGCHSTFFFVPFKDIPGWTETGAPIAGRAVKYDVAELKSEIDYLIQHGCEIGVHGLDGWYQPEAALRELVKIQSITGQKRLGVRMHWLYNHPDTPSVLEKTGYRYDSTWGYNQKPGFRAGTFQVYKPLQAKTLLELPMHIMDTALFYPEHMGLTFDEGLQRINTLADSAASFGGVLTVNWHHRSIAPERLWDSVYLRTLKALKSRAARFATAEAVVEWFEKRRAVRFEKIVKNCASIKINISAGGKAIGTGSDMVLRVHTPAGHLQGSQNTSFLDHVLQSRHEISSTPSGWQRGHCAN
jgi:hypothetical protein